VAKPAWRSLRGVAQGRLRAARLDAHYAVQWLARAARAFVPPRPDDGHTNLGWDGALDGLATHPLVGELRLGLRIPDLTLLLLGGAEAQPSFPLDRRTDADARRWLGAQLAACGLDAAKLDAPAPYAMPDHPLAHGGAYAAGALADALTELTAWFASASMSLGALYERMIGRGLKASPLRCWPHHFDIATLTLVEGGEAEHAPSVNAGFSPGDEHYAEPYFYVRPYPYPEPAKLPPLPEVGHWHVKGFTAAIAPASRILPAEDCQATADEFLDAAITAAIEVLR
jgi:hypothetical protein